MALQGVQMPSIAGVYGVKDFREDLRPDGGLGKLAQMAMNLYQLKSNQAQQKEMQDAAQQFQIAEKEKERKLYAQQQADAKAAQEAQKLATWKKDANYVSSLDYDKNNDASMVQTQNNIRKVIEDGLAAGKGVIICQNKEEAVAAVLAPLYQRLNGIQGDRNILGQTVAKNNTVKDIQATIAEGAIDTAMGDIADAVGAGIIDQHDADKLMVRLNEKKGQLEKQAFQDKQMKYNWNRQLKKDAESDKKPRLQLK